MPTTSLRSISVGGFRSIRAPQEIALSSTLTVLVGRNNVGKSAYLQAMAPLYGDRAGTVPSSYKTSMTWTLDASTLNQYIQPGTWYVAGISEALRQAQTIDLDFEIETLRPAPELRTTDRESPTDSHFRTSQGLDLQVSAARLGPHIVSFERRARRVPNSGTFTWADGTNASLYPVSELPAKVLALCQALIRSIFYVGPLRSPAPRAQLNATPQLAPDGTNLTNVLADLYNNQRRTVYPLVESFIREAFPEVGHVDIELRHGVPPTVEVILEYPGVPRDRVPLQYCGTGIEQALMLAVAILATPDVQVLLIDEPHAYLHPSAERVLLRLITGHPEKQYVIATHSPGFISAARSHSLHLVRRGPRGTETITPTEQVDILTELGVTAADVWANDAILFVEGPTELAIFDTIRNHSPERLDGIGVRQMPEQVRSARSRPAELDRLLKLFETVAMALLPFDVKASVLFDADGLAPHVQEEVVSRARIPVYYLPCCEIENLLLCPEAVAHLINIKREALGLDPIHDREVADQLDSVLAQIGDTALYPTGTTPNPRLAVKGSVALERLFDAFQHLRYHKVQDGAKLAHFVLDRSPDQLGPLLAPIDALRTR